MKIGQIIYLNFTIVNKLLLGKTSTTTIKPIKAIEIVIISPHLKVKSVFVKIAYKVKAVVNNAVKATANNTSKGSKKETKAEIDKLSNIVKSPSKKKFKGYFLATDLQQNNAIKIMMAQSPHRRVNHQFSCKKSL